MKICCISYLYGVVCVQLAHFSLGNWKDIYIAHVIIIIKSDVSILPIVVIFFRWCVPEMFVTSYSVTYYNIWYFHESQWVMWMVIYVHSPLHWRQNDHHGVSNHQPHGCLLNRLFRLRSKKTSKLRVTGAGEFPAQRASYAKNVSIWWRHPGHNQAHHMLICHMQCMLCMLGCSGEMSLRLCMFTVPQRIVVTNIQNGGGAAA